MQKIHRGIVLAIAFGIALTSHIASEAQSDAGQASDPAKGAVAEPQKAVDTTAKLGGATQPAGVKLPGAVAGDSSTPLAEPAKSPGELGKSPDQAKSSADQAQKSAMDTTKRAGAAAAKPVEPEPVKPKVGAPVDPKAPYTNVEFAKGEKPRVVMETSMGKLVLELWPDVAPKHCQSFVHLVNKNFYDSIMFHRIIANFVIQGGDPQGTGSGGPGYTVPAEFSDTLKHDLGILSMARTPDPNSAGSQFFICLGRERTAALDKQYTIFGKVVEGLDVVQALGKVPTNGPPIDRPLTPVHMTKVYMEKKG